LGPNTKGENDGNQRSPAAVSKFKQTENVKILIGEKNTWNDKGVLSKPCGHRGSCGRRCQGKLHERIEVKGKEENDKRRCQPRHPVKWQRDALRSATRLERHALGHVPGNIKGGYGTAYRNRKNRKEGERRRYVRPG